MHTNDMLWSGVNDQMLPSGVNDEELGTDFDDQDQDLDNDNDQDNDQDQDQDDDQDNQNNNQNQNQQNEKVKKQNLHKTITNQNKTISNLQKEINALKNPDISEEDMAAIRAKYNEEDLAIIEKIIVKKSNEILNQRETSTLAQKELNIFLKDYPDLTEPEVKHIQDLQKTYGYSLKKAHSILFPNAVKPQKQVNRSVSNSFNGGNNNNSNKSKDSDQDAYNAMSKYL